MDSTRKGHIFPVADICLLGADLVAEIAQAEDIRLQQPNLLNARASTSVLTHGIASLGLLRAPKSVIYKIPRFSLVGPGLIEIDGAIVRDSIGNCAKTSNLSIFNRISRDDSYTCAQRDVAINHHQDGPYLVVGQIWDGSYGHFVYETLARLLLARSWIRQVIPDCVIVLLNYPPSMRSKWEQLIHEAGFPNKILYSSGERDFFADSFWMPLSTKHPLIVHPAHIRALNEFAEDVSTRHGVLGSGAERIYLSRNMMGTRRFRNEQQILVRLASMGFEILDRPESLSCVEQILLMRNLKIMAGNNGGAISNLFFMPDGGTLLLFSSPLMQDDMFYVASSLKSMNYVSVHGNSVGDVVGMNADFEIPETLFDEALSLLSLTS